ncbi:MAG: DinB family protein [Planctomycetota bacterium]
MDSTLIRQLEHRYGVLYRSLTEELEEAYVWRPLGSRPPIGWHAAHIAEAMASTLEATVTGPGGVTLSPGLARCAERGGPPFASMEREDLVAELRVLSGQVLDELKSLTEEDFDRPPLVPIEPAFLDHLTSRRVWIEGHVFHVTYHLGAMGLLRAHWA